MADPYVGQPTHLIMTNTPSIEITDSDCEAALVPDNAPVNDRVIPKVDHNSNISVKFRVKTATLIMHDAKFWDGLRRDMTFTMPRFPAGYELYLSSRPDEKSTKDRYLIGFRAQDKPIVFRSPFEFAPHAKWLAYGRPEGACACTNCTGVSQGEISKKLKKAVEYIKWTNKIDVGPYKRRKSTRHPEERRIRRKIGKERYEEIAVKDYTQRRAGTSSDQAGPSGTS